MSYKHVSSQFCFNLFSYYKLYITVLRLSMNGSHLSLNYIENFNSFMTGAVII